MDENLTPIEKLDNMLMYFVNMDMPPFKTDAEIMKELNITRSKEMFEIFHKLEKDGFIKSEVLPVHGRNTTVYSSTFDGRLFNLNGGYAQQDADNSIANRNERIQTLLLTYGTAAAGIYGFFEIAKWFFHHEHWKIFF